MNQKEQPKELPINELIFEDNNILLLNLIEWYKDIYCKIDFKEKMIVEDISHVKDLECNTIVQSNCEQDLCRTAESQNISTEKLIDEGLYKSQDINIRLWH